MFTHLNILPRWIIFIIDLLISSLSVAIAYLIKINFELSKLDYVSFSHIVLIVFVVSACAFFALKTYAGIIRYTSAQDSFRILSSVIVIGGVLFLFNMLTVAFTGSAFISNTVLLTNALTCFLGMVCYRMMAKYFFLYIKNINLDRKRAIIYGVGEAAVAAKRTFDHDHQVNKEIIAFLDDDPQMIGKRLLGIKILSSNKLTDLITNKNLHEIIFASADIALEKKNKVVDLCLENGIKVLTIPSHESWTSGKLKPAQIQNIKIEDLLNRKPIDIDIAGIKNELKGKRVLITGAAGSIGSEIVRQLLNFDAGLIIMCDQSETALHHLYLEMQDRNIDVNFHAFVGDVRDVNRMTYLFESYKPHYVYHAAAYKHVPLMEDNASEAIKTNVLGTKIIADLSVKYGVQKFVMISTDKAVNPTNVMGASKRIAEIYVQSLNHSLAARREVINGSHNNNTPYILSSTTGHQTRFITTRFGNVLGSNGSVIPRFKEQIERGGPITVTHPEITRYFMTIPEACRLVLEAGCMGKGGEIFVFDMGKSVKILDLAKRMIQLAGLEPGQDVKIEYTGLRPGEKLFEELLNDHENTMPTHHEKIMIGRVREHVFEEVEMQIEGLLRYARTNDNVRVVRTMKQMVHEFKSQNSIFEELDLILKS